MRRICLRSFLAIGGLIAVGIFDPSNEAEAFVKLKSEIFQSHMMLQADRPIVVKGRASLNIDYITVTHCGETITVGLNPKGDFEVILPAKPAWTNCDIIFQGNQSRESDTIALTDVLYGEVFAYIGQSNAGKPRKYFQDYRDSSIPIRVYRDHWEDSIGAHPLAFANYMTERLKVPVAILNESVGGSRIQTWMGDTAKVGKLNYNKNFQVYIRPLLGFEVRGVVYWQGEANVYQPEVFGSLLRELIRSYRREWGLTRLPFVVQRIPVGSGPFGPNGARMLQQFATLETEANLGDVAVANSSGLRSALHPNDYRGYARRIGDAAIRQFFN